MELAKERQAEPRQTGMNPGKNASGAKLGIPRLKRDIPSPRLCLKRPPKGASYAKTSRPFPQTVRQSAK